MGAHRSLVRGNLPAPLSSFVGRADELAAVRDALRANRCVTLTGAGGCGKSRLAAEAAARSADGFPDGVWWVELAPLTDPELVTQAVSGALGLRDAARGVVDQVAAFLGSSTSLVVLDNCEHVLEASADVVHRLLTACGGLTVLATSREPLGVPGEVAWRVPSLPFPESDAAVDSGSLAGFDATRLFCERAAQARPGLRFDDRAARSVGVICRRLDGIPLAIELAAARTRALDVDRIAAGLDDRFRLLTGGPRTAPRRHQTLLASVEWSVAQLPAAEAALLRRLSVFAGSFTLDAAEAVACGGDIAPGAVLVAIAALVDKSLVVMEEHDGVARYRLLETIRQYTAGHLQEAGEEPATRARHLHFYRDRAEAAEPAVDSGDRACLTGLEADLDNIRAAHDWGLTHDPDSAVRLVAALPLFWYQRGHYREGRRRLQAALDAAPDMRAPLQAKVLWGLGHLAFYQGDFLEAYGVGLRTAEVAGASGDDGLRARALGLLGWMELFVDPPAARFRLDAAVPAARAAGDGWCLADCLQATGWSYLVQEDHVGARPFLEETEQVAARLGNPYFRAWNGGAFGQMWLRTGDFGAAVDALEKGVEASAAVGEPSTLAWALGFLAEARVAIGDYEGARAVLADVSLATLERRMGAAPIKWWLAPQYTALDRAGGDRAAARRQLEAAVERARTETVAWALAMNLTTLAELEVDEGDFAAAAAHATEAAAVGDRLGNRWVRAGAAHVLGRVAESGDDLAAAEARYHEALAIRAEGGFEPAVVESIEVLAGLAARLESWVEAARLLGAADRRREELGYRRWPAHEPRYEALTALVREALGPEAFADAWSEGQRLSAADTVAYLQRARGERRRPTTGWASLTPTEQEVVACVADGLSNPRIGERLFMSLSTVKTHLGHIFGKLGVTSRAELAALAARREDR